MLILLDTKLIKAFYASNDMYRKKLEIYGFLPDLLGQGLITANGNVHKRHRKITSRVFHWDFLMTTVPMIVKTTKEIFDEIEVKKSFTEVKMIEHAQAITGIVVGRIFFGKNLNCYNYEGKPLTLALVDIMNEVALSGRTTLAVLLGPNFMKLSPYSKFSIAVPKIKKFRKFCFDIIQDRKKSAIPGLRSFIFSLSNTKTRRSRTTLF